MRRGALALLSAYILSPAVPVQAEETVVAPVAPAEALSRLAALNSNHPYLPMARHVLEQAERRAAGQSVRGAVLVEKVSLIEPRAIECGNKPLALLIDLDPAPGDTIIEGQPAGFGALLQVLRDAGIAIGWISQRTPALLESDISALRSGPVPAFRDDDIQLPAASHHAKQDRRIGLAASHCVLAIAGDRRADFDILFDYLRDPDYAIRLEAWMDRGWFLLPYPASVADAELSPEVKEVEQPNDQP